MEKRWRIAFWALLAATALLLLIRIGSAPLHDPDESRFARTSLEMLRGGDPVVPRFEGQPRLVKPPLLHWIQAALFATFGASEWTARLHAALATLVSLALLAWIVRRRYGEEGAFWAALVFATIPLVVVLGRIGNLDALLSVHILAAIALDLAGPREAGPARGFALGALLGLAFLVKGPVGVILPLLIMLAGRTAAGREVVGNWRTVGAAVGGWCVVVLPWGLAFLKRIGLEAASATVRAETLERFFSGTSHVEPPWFYLLVILAGFFPWQVPLLAGLGRLVRYRRDPAAATARYAGAGLVAGLVFLSLSQGKLPNYVLPLVPLAAIVVVWELGRELETPRRRVVAPSLLAATLGTLAVGFALAVRSGLESEPRTVALAGAVVYGVGLLACLPGLVLRRPRWVYGSAGASAAAFLLVVVLVLTPFVSRTRTAGHLIDAVPALRSTRPVVVVDMKVPSMTYYLDRVPEMIESPELSSRLDQDDDPLVVFDEVDLSHVPEAALSRLREIGRQGKYRVYEKE